VRKFKRISEETLERILSESRPAEDATAGDATSGAAGEAGEKAAEDRSPASSTDTPVAPPGDDVPIAPPENPDDDRPL